MRQPPNPRNNAILEFILGAILVLAIQLIVGVLTIVLIFGMAGVINSFHIPTPDASLVAIAGSPFLFIGITQIAYLAPLFTYFTRRGRREVSKGILLGAIVTFLLNSACFASPEILSVTSTLGLPTYGSLALRIAIALLISGTIGWLGVKRVSRSGPQ
jgi:uncharacterized BrkB/YihY/UPF0761 family membrane protein